MGLFDLDYRCVLVMALPDVIVLCGGLGTRLKELIPDRPKCLAMVRSKPFLDILVDWLVTQGVTRLVLATGHMKEQVRAHFVHRRDAQFIFSEEAIPLGTGGAVVNALPLVRGDPFFVTNGDSYCGVSLNAVCDAHRNAKADATIVVARAGTRRDAGQVVLNQAGHVICFQAKPRERLDGNSNINAGVYLMQKRSFNGLILDRPISLEADVLPHLVRAGRCHGFVVGSEVIDIGTPERFLEAQEKFR